MQYTEVTVGSTQRKIFNASTDQIYQAGLELCHLDSSGKICSSTVPLLAFSMLLENKCSDIPNYPIQYTFIEKQTNLYYPKDDGYADTNRYALAVDWMFLKSGIGSPETGIGYASEYNLLLVVSGGRGHYTLDRLANNSKFSIPYTYLSEEAKKILDASDQIANLQSAIGADTLDLLQPQISKCLGYSVQLKYMIYTESLSK